MRELKENRSGKLWDFGGTVKLFINMEEAGSFEDDPHLQDLTRHFKRITGGIDLTEDRVNLLMCGEHLLFEAKSKNEAQPQV